MQSNLFVTLIKSSIVIFTLCVFFSTVAYGKPTNKTEAYKQSQLKTVVTTHGDKFKLKKKIRPLNPLPFLKRPSLDGNFYHQQQYQAAQKRLKTHSTLGGQSTQN